MSKRKLVHLSFEKIGEFTPRIPMYIRPEENNSIERICLSNTIENALGAVPWFGSGGCPENIMSDIGSKIIFVHEFEIEENFLKKPEEVLLIGSVSDAVLNKEYWYVGDKNLTPSRVYTISITDYYEEEVNILSPNLQKIYDEENGDIDIDDYYNLEEEMYYSTVFKPTEIEYNIVSNVITGNSFSIYYKDELAYNFENIIRKSFEMQLTTFDCDFSEDFIVVNNIEYNCITVNIKKTISFNKDEIIKHIKDSGIDIQNIVIN